MKIEIDFPPLPDLPGDIGESSYHIAFCKPEPMDTYLSPEDGKWTLADDWMDFFCPVLVITSPWPTQNLKFLARVTINGDDSGEVFTIERCKRSQGYKYARYMLKSTKTGVSGRKWIAEDCLTFVRDAPKDEYDVFASKNTWVSQ